VKSNQGVRHEKMVSFDVDRFAGHGRLVRANAGGGEEGNGGRCSWR